MQEKSILLWSSSASLLLQGRYIVTVCFLHFWLWYTSGPASESFYMSVFVHVSTLQEAVFSLWLWWETAAWTYDPFRAARVVTVGFDGRLDGAFHLDSCCPETCWAGQRSSRSAMVMRTMTMNENSTPRKCLLSLSSFSSLLFSWADVSRFFSASCVPGAAAMASPLCALCQGQKSYIRQRNYRCETSHSEPFYSSQGALRSGITKDHSWMFAIFNQT